MLSYFFPSKQSEEEARSGEDKHAKQFDAAKKPSSALERAMKVHTITAKIHYEKGVVAAREEVEGVEEAFVIHNVLTPAECERYIQLTEELGYTDAPISTGLDSAVMMKDVRDNLRVMWEASKEMMDPMWQRVASLIPETLVVGSSGKKWRIVKEHPLNERFRFYRYDAEQVFQPHFDGCFPRNRTPGEEEQSHFTFIIYLNAGFDGGETTFFPGSINSLWNKSRVTHKERRVNPITGSALLFRHTGINSPLHEGSAHHTKGMRKYVLRTDVMYRAE